MLSTDALTLEAFVTALTHLDQPLDANTQATLNQIALTLDQDEAGAINQLRQLAQHPPLQAPYKLVRAELQKNYKAQERQKFIPFLDAATNGNGATDTDEPEALQLLNTCHDILGAPNPVDSAQRQQRLIKAYEHALLIFRGPNYAWDWLTSPNGALAGVIPIDLMGTDAEAHQVHTILGRIEHGVFS